MLCYKDIKYANKFWEIRQPNGLREVMTENILSAGGKGKFITFVNPEGIDEEDIKRLSAYKVLAQEFNFEIGRYHLENKSGAVVAKIKKLK